jgi:hypothetical protein
VLADLGVGHVQAGRGGLLVGHGDEGPHLEEVREAPGDERRHLRAGGRAVGVVGAVTVALDDVDALQLLDVLLVCAGDVVEAVTSGQLLARHLFDGAGDERRHLRAIDRQTSGRNVPSSYPVTMPACLEVGDVGGVGRADVLRVVEVGVAAIRERVVVVGHGAKGVGDERRHLLAGHVLTGAVLEAAIVGGGALHDAVGAEAADRVVVGAAAVDVTEALRGLCSAAAGGSMLAPRRRSGPSPVLPTRARERRRARARRVRSEGWVAGVRRSALHRELLVRSGTAGPAFPGASSRPISSRCAPAGNSSARPSNGKQPDAPREDRVAPRSRPQPERAARVDRRA